MSHSPGMGGGRRGVGSGPGTQCPAPNTQCPISQRDTQRGSFQGQGRGCTAGSWRMGQPGLGARSVRRSFRPWGSLLGMCSKWLGRGAGRGVWGVAGSQLGPPTQPKESGSENPRNLSYLGQPCFWNLHLPTNSHCSHGRSLFPKLLVKPLASPPTWLLPQLFSLPPSPPWYWLGDLEWAIWGSPH